MRHGKARFVTGFLALPLALYLWYVVWPFAQSIGYSFTDWGGYSDEQHFVGFANYVRLFNDELIRKAFWHTVFFLVTVPLITIALALFFAFLLNVGGRGNRAGIRGVWGSGVYKIIFFFPQVLSLVLIAVMWQAIYRGDDQGLLNGLLIKTGLVDKDHPLGFVADPTPFLGVPAVLWWILLHRRLGRGRLLPGAVLRGHAVDPEGHLRGGGARRRRPGQHVLPGHPAAAAGHRLDRLGVPGLHRAGHVRPGVRDDAEPGRARTTPARSSPRSSTSPRSTAAGAAATATPARWASRWASSP